VSKEGEGWCGQIGVSFPEQFQSGRNVEGEKTGDGTNSNKCTGPRKLQSHKRFLNIGETNDRWWRCNRDKYGRRKKYITLFRFCFCYCVRWCTVA
jgi:hypothetical protein